MGPNQSIIWCLTSTGQGAAAWITHRRLETSYLLRTASGSLSIRTNIVGTNWAWVTRWVSISRSTVSASNFAHDDRRGPDTVDRHGVVDAGRVVQRRGGEVHAGGLHPVLVRSAPSPAPPAPRTRCRRPAAGGGPPWASRWCPTSRASPTRRHRRCVARRSRRVLVRVPAGQLRHRQPCGRRRRLLTSRICAASSAIEASTNTAFASESSMT